MTLSFWGWRHLKANNFTGSVELYSVSNSNSNSLINDDNDENIETLELIIYLTNDQNDKHKAKWYHEDFNIKSNRFSNISHFNIYYSVSAGQHHEINLRDVWVRSKSSVSPNQLPHYCLPLFHILYYWVLYSILSSYGILIILYCLFKLSKKLKHYLQLYLHTTGLLWIIYWLLTEYGNEYPGIRCKNDDYFITIVIISCFILVLTIILFTYNDSDNNDNNNNDDDNNAGIYDHTGTLEALNTMLETLQSLERILANNENGHNHHEENNIENSDIINIATENSRKENQGSQGETSIHLKVFNSNENECSICMESYSMQRCRILTECGHVYCSHCMKDICKMSPQQQGSLSPSSSYRYQTGLCPTCRSVVSLKNIILLHPPSNESINTNTIDNDLENGECGNSRSAESELEFHKIFD